MAISLFWDTELISGLLHSGGPIRGPPDIVYINNLKAIQFFSLNRAHQDLNYLEKEAHIFENFELFCH